MSYYSKVKILTNLEGAKALARAAMAETSNPILSLDNAGNVVVDDGCIEVPESRYYSQRIREAETVIISWPSIQWYCDAHEDCEAIERVIIVGEYPLKMIRIGEDFDDVEVKSAYSSDYLLNELGIVMEVCADFEIF